MKLLHTGFAWVSGSGMGGDVSNHSSLGETICTGVLHVCFGKALPWVKFDAAPHQILSDVFSGAVSQVTRKN